MPSDIEKWADVTRAMGGQFVTPQFIKHCKSCDEPFDCCSERHRTQCDRCEYKEKLKTINFGRVHGTS